MPLPFMHALLRWQIRRQQWVNERDAAQRELTHTEPPAARARLQERMAAAERQLRLLGPEPTAKMG